MAARLRVLAVALLALLLAAGPALAQDADPFPAKPPDGRFWVDDAACLRSGEREAIDRIGAALLRDESTPLRVVTVRTLGPGRTGAAPFDAWARDLLERWGDGETGIVLVVALVDRRVRIEMGRTWGHRYDENARRVIDDVILPAFRRGAYSQGVLDGVTRLDGIARGREIPRPPVPWWILLCGAALLSVVAAVASSLLREGRSGWGWAALRGVCASIVGAILAPTRRSYWRRDRWAGAWGSSIRGGSSRGSGGGSSWSGSRGGGGGGASGSW